MGYKMNGFSGFKSSPAKHLKSDDKVHMELWGGKHTNADHPDHWDEKKQDKDNPDVVKTEGTSEEQKLRRKKKGYGEFKKK